MVYYISNITSVVIIRRTKKTLPHSRRTKPKRQYFTHARLTCVSFVCIIDNFSVIVLNKR